MRELKFRCKVARKNGHVFSEIFSIDQIESGKIALWLEANHISTSTKVIREQSTCLKDKYGVEIFEGDIILFKDFYSGWNPGLKKSIWDAICVIEWNEEECRFALTEKNGNQYCFLSNNWFCYEFEVIGNIHED
jgi:uncharacterized phage protein (TIGR01671 family)